MTHVSYESTPLLGADAAASRTRTSVIRTGVVAVGLCLLAAAVALSAGTGVGSSLG